jgi:hypothetical protein
MNFQSKKRKDRVWTGLAWLTIRTSYGLFYNGDEVCDSIKTKKFPDYVRKYQFLEKSVP